MTRLYLNQQSCLTGQHSVGHHSFSTVLGECSTVVYLCNNGHVTQYGTWHSTVGILQKGLRERGAKGRRGTPVIWKTGRKEMWFCGFDSDNTLGLRQFIKYEFNQTPIQFFLIYCAFLPIRYSSCVHGQSSGIPTLLYLTPYCNGARACGRFHQHLPDSEGYDSWISGLRSCYEVLLYPLVIYGRQLGTSVPPLGVPLDALSPISPNEI
ncbi:hypothetical protein BDQ17DRAFT_1333535 [Cyathus striatus]|nr:hypothetical protein BDQ17DRAFT_1333535 [Cyathus striatus]